MKKELVKKNEIKLLGLLHAQIIKMKWIRNRPKLENYLVNYKNNEEWLLQMKVRYFIPVIRKIVFIILVVFTTQLIFADNISNSQAITLNGKNLTIAEVVKIARQNALVKIDDKALEKVQRS